MQTPVGKALGRGGICANVFPCCFARAALTLLLFVVEGMGYN
jgi:hypothetical protein